MALSGDATAMRICFDRLAPPPRAEAAPVVIEGLAEAIGLKAKAERLIQAVGQGEIAPDTAVMLLNALASYAKAVEVEELSERIAQLEGASK